MIVIFNISNRIFTLRILDAIGQLYRGQITRSSISSNTNCRWKRKCERYLFIRHVRHILFSLFATERHREQDDTHVAYPRGPLPIPLPERACTLKLNARLNSGRVDTRVDVDGE
jgi:hypothetical protein